MNKGFVHTIDQTQNFFKSNWENFLPQNPPLSEMYRTCHNMLIVDSVAKFNITFFLSTQKTLKHIFFKEPVLPQIGQNWHDAKKMECVHNVSCTAY